MVNEVGSYLADLVDGQMDILEFEMESGGKLRITPDHPLVTEDGYLRAANTFKTGEHLVKADGSLDPIHSITPQTFLGKVYNVQPKTAENVSNVLVAEGYLNGSSRYQNENVMDLNRLILRTTLPEKYFKYH
jgi:hypothetical protein